MSDKNTRPVLVCGVSATMQGHADQMMSLVKEYARNTLGVRTVLTYGDSREPAQKMFAKNVR